MMHYQSWISLLIAQTLTLLNQHQQQIEQKAANNQRTALEMYFRIVKALFWLYILYFNLCWHMFH